MTVLNRIAFFQNRKDEGPNQELARELVAADNVEGIREIAENLFNKDRNIQSDCIKVMYEAGYLKPEMIADYVGDFMSLLKSKNNRAVWGAMLALSTIAHLKPDELYQQIDDILKAMKEGSVITVDNAVKVLAIVAAQNEEYSRNIFPRLLEHLRNCRPKEVAQHAESIFLAVNPQNQQEYLDVLRTREESVTSSQLSRLKKIYKKLK